jgi:hypothetical protein
VVAHHLVRIVLIIVGSPLAAAWLRRHATKAAPP